jgi:hypothetical protein
MQNLSFKTFVLLGSMSVLMWSCSKESVSSTSSGLNQTSLVAVGQTSAQLASGASFSIASSSTSGSSNVLGGGPGGQHGGCPNGGMGSFLDGTDFLTPTNELIAIVDAESAGDMRGNRMYENGGAKITNYDASGNVITLPHPSMNAGPEGASFSSGQFPQSDSLLAKIVKTVIDFGSGVSVQHDSITITRVGKIVITRTTNGSTHTETISFENYSVNNNSIEGTKTRTNTFDQSTGKGQSITTVANGKITFSDGSVATWTSTRERDSQIVIDPTTNRPSSGTIVSTASVSVGSIYSHVTTKAVTEDLSCGRDRHWPVSGTVETKYRSNDVVVDFGDGTCSNKTISITINGVTTTKTIGT